MARLPLQGASHGSGVALHHSLLVDARRVATPLPSVAVAQPVRCTKQCGYTLQRATEKCSRESIFSLPELRDPGDRQSTIIAIGRASLA